MSRGWEEKLLEDARRGRACGEWHEVPEARVRALLADSEPEAAPAGGAPPSQMEWNLTDVRSAPGLEPRRLASRILDDGEVGLSADHTGKDGAWTLQGKVWLRDETGSARVLLRQDEHVLAMATVRSGETFAFEEFLVAGWAVEVHLSSGQTLVIPDLAT